jgi:hypothetical protein
LHWWPHKADYLKASQRITNSRKTLRLFDRWSPEKCRNPN